MNTTTLDPAWKGPPLTPKGARKEFTDTAAIPWTPWIMPGTHFKLFYVDEASGRFTFLLKVDPGTEAPVHWHLGTAEAYILEGGFYYFEDDQGFPGAYTAEMPGAIHQPVSPKGCVMFAVAHGPLSGFNPDGSIGGICDAKLMYQLAQQGNAAAHVVRMGFIGEH